MHLQLYDTLRREIRTIQPMDGACFRFYCCGPTVYGPAHIGNFRTFLVQDLFRRLLEGLAIPIRHVRNLTDVDDKTIRQSQAEGVSLSDFTAKWTEKFHQDCEALNLLPPQVEPSAVAHIPEQVQLIQTLLDDGIAYTGEDGSVYYRVEAWPAYGKLSRVTERSLQSAPNQADEYGREAVADFALWKAWKPEDGANVWEAPWGRGRPGWHIECSAMAMKYLGDSFDLHSGGVDLIFPHHENEIAQSEAATGKPFARHWFHIAHLRVNGQKMSKSLGNLYTLADIQAKGVTPEALRYTLLNGHYRQPLNFSWDTLAASEKALHKLKAFQDQLPPPQKSQPWQRGPLDPVWEALCDDLNTPEAIGRLFGLLKTLRPAAMPPAETETLSTQFETLCHVLGLLRKDSAGPPPQVLDLAEQRWQARQTKDYALADTLRTQLLEHGWQMQDQADTYTLTPAPQLLKT